LHWKTTFIEKKKFHWKTACIEKPDFIKNCFLKKNASIENYSIYKMLHLKLFSTFDGN
jgi:hypothetical protein